MLWPSRCPAPFSLPAFANAWKPLAHVRLFKTRKHAFSIPRTDGDSKNSLSSARARRLGGSRVPVWRSRPGDIGLRPSSRLRLERGRLGGLDKRGESFRCASSEALPSVGARRAGRCLDFDERRLLCSSLPEGHGPLRRRQRRVLQVSVTSLYVFCIYWYIKLHLTAQFRSFFPLLISVP